jgi:hypothetical protein
MVNRSCERVIDGLLVAFWQWWEKKVLKIGVLLNFAAFNEQIIAVVIAVATEDMFDV